MCSPRLRHRVPFLVRGHGVGACVSVKVGRSWISYSRTSRFVLPSTFRSVDDFVVGSNSAVKVPPPPPPYRYLALADQAKITLPCMFPAAAGTSGTSIGPSVVLGSEGLQQQWWQKGPGGEYVNHVAVLANGHDVAANMLVKSVVFLRRGPHAQRLMLKVDALLNISVASTSNVTFHLLWRV